MIGPDRRQQPCCRSVPNTGSLAELLLVADHDVEPLRRHRPRAAPARSRCCPRGTRRCRRRPRSPRRRRASVPTSTRRDRPTGRAAALEEVGHRLEVGGSPRSRARSRPPRPSARTGARRWASRADPPHGVNWWFAQVGDVGGRMVDVDDGDLRRSPGLSGLRR